MATAPITNNAASVLVPGTLGTHRLSAVSSAFSDGIETYNSAALTATHVVTGLSVDLSLAATPNPAGVGQQVTFTFAATNATSTPSGSLQPSGSISLSDNPVSISNGTVSGPNGLVFTAGHSFTVAGTHTVTASYSGDALHSPASVSITVEIAASPPPRPSWSGPTRRATASPSPSPLTSLRSTARTSLRRAQCSSPSATDPPASGTLNEAGATTVMEPAPGAYAQPAGPCSAIAELMLNLAHAPERHPG